MKGVTEYGQREGGARNLGVEVGEVRVLVQPNTEADNAAARAVAERIHRSEEMAEELHRALNRADALNADLSAKVSALEAKLREARTISEAAIAGRRRFFGPVLMKPAKPGDWTGAVWLLDPEKRERGMGLRFDSTAEVRALHPELWVMSVEADGSILLDAWAAKATP